MVVASADGAGSPSARYVLMKGYDERGFVFYSNYTSRKGRELANGRARPPCASTGSRCSTRCRALQMSC